ncbi:hypothetical protein [Nocardioides sp.]|uniref:hypothetical protein n=1 Tax=Nocardioides sp. TaxID=35761 RepID=UPI003783E1A0
MSELLLVAVPGGDLTDHDALLRVVVVPRLFGHGTALADYGMANWARALRDAPGSLEVRLSPGSGPDLDPVHLVPTHRADPAVWAGFFDHVGVTPYAAPAPYDTPQVATSADDAHAVATAYEGAVEDPSTVADQLEGLSFGPMPPTPDPDAAVVDRGDPDFHRVVALMRQHPAVLAALGLVLEVRLPRDLLRRCGDAGRISVGWPDPPVALDVPPSPQTEFEVTRRGFFAAPGPDDIVTGGLVDLARTTPGADRPDWELRTFDIDGAVGQLQNASAAVRRARAEDRRRRRTDPDPAAMPPLRSVGLQLVHRKRETWVHDRHGRGLRNATQDAPPVLTADDLVLGYRLDVRYGGQEWHSVMWRNARYEVGGVVIGGGWQREEAHLVATAAVKGTGERLFVDGVVARWSGHRLGLPQQRLDGVPPDARVVRPLPYRFTWEFQNDPQEPEGMPELRFSSGYQLRLRAVDLAGGGLPTRQDLGEDGATPLKTYARHEPVRPPEMPPPAGLLTTVVDADGRARPRVDPTLLGPGGSLERLVVRSDPGGADPSHDPGLPPNHSRTLLPPPANFELSEWEDRLSGVDETAWRLARRAITAPQASAEKRAGRHYTWLPDVAATSAAARLVPEAERLAVLPSTLDGWPAATWPDHDAKGVHVVPVERHAPYRVAWVDGVAEVELPPAFRGVLEVSSAIDSTYFGRFDASAVAPLGSTARQLVIEGRHPVVTPARRIEVVHAVRAPLDPPAGVLEARREEGGTWAVLADGAAPRLGLDRDSTAQLDVAASWQEWTDAPEPTPVTQSVGSFPVDLEAEALPEIRHHFGDTRHREVTYRLAAHSRFREFFPATDPESAFLREATLAPVHVDSTVRPTAPVVLAVTPASALTERPPLFHPQETTTGFGVEVDEDGDGVLDGVDYDGDGHADLVPPAPVVAIDYEVVREGGILRVELDHPWFSTGQGEQLGVVVSPGPGADGIARAPGLDPTGRTTASHDNAFAHLVTTAHRDPARLGDPPPQPDHTTLSRAGGDPLLVEDQDSGALLVVVPFDVFAADGRWFADIGFSALADDPAQPMVRLALVRFQRHSLPGRTTSPVVTTDPVGVLPHRSLLIRTRNNDVTVQVDGRPGAPASALEMRVEVAPTAALRDQLTALPGSGAEGATWQVQSRHAAQFGSAFDTITLPYDPQHARRLVVREYDELPSALTGPTDDPLPPDLYTELNLRTTFLVVHPI